MLKIAHLRRFGALLAMAAVAGSAPHVAAAGGTAILPPQYTDNDRQACDLFITAYYDTLPRDKRKPWFAASKWWFDASFQRGPGTIEGIYAPDVGKRLSPPELAAAAEACRQVSKGRFDVALAPHTRRLTGAPDPQQAEAPSFTLAELYPDQSPADEDEVDCAVALLHAQSAAAGQPDKRRDSFRQAFAAMVSRSTPFFRQDGWHLRAAARSDHMVRTLGSAATLDIAGRCLAPDVGKGAAVNPYRQQLMGPERWNRFAARQALEAALAARRAEEERQRAQAASSAAASVADSAPVSRVDPRCDRTLSEGIRFATGKMQSAYASAQIWLLTGRGPGGSAGWDDFEGACRSIGSTEKTLQNMSCPAQFIDLARTARNRLQLNLGNGTSYCREDWR